MQQDIEIFPRIKKMYLDCLVNYFRFTNENKNPEHTNPKLFYVKLNTPLILILGKQSQGENHL